MQVLNSSAIASGYAGRDPQGGFAMEALQSLLKSSKKIKRRFFSVFKLRKGKKNYVMLKLEENGRMRRWKNQKTIKATMYKWSEWRRSWKRYCWYNLQK